jgi:hypothetical protein
LVADKLAEASSARALLLVERVAQGTGHGTYSTYWTSSMQEAPGRTVNTRDLLVGAATARLTPAPAPAELSTVGIGSTKLCPNSYNQTNQQDQKRE